MRIGDAMLFRVFDGTIVAQNLVLETPFGKLSRLSADDPKERPRRCQIEPFIEIHSKAGRPLRHHLGEGIAGASRRRTQNKLGNEVVPGKVAAHQARGGCPSFAKRAIFIGGPRRSVRFGVAQQDESAHGGSIDFADRKVQSIGVA